jgi:hypothetical protein
MSADQITEEAVYQCTGNPLPKDIEQVAHWLLNEKFTDAFESACLTIFLMMALVVCDDTI